MSGNTNDIPVFAVPVKLSDIRTDGGTQVRVSINKETIFDYRDKMVEFVDFPPIVLFYGPGTDGVTGYWLADGFHRFYGAREAKALTERDSIMAIVHKGSAADALLYAAGANSKHGLKMSAEDKRNTVMMLLKDSKWSKKSAAWIAEKCGFSNSFVSKVRAEHESTLLEKGCEPKTYEGRDGKKRKLPVNKPKNKRVERADEQVIIPMVAAVKEVDAVRNNGPCPHGGDHVPGADGDCKRCLEPGVGKIKERQLSPGFQSHLDEAWDATNALANAGVSEKSKSEAHDALIGIAIALDNKTTKVPFGSLSQALEALSDAVAAVAERWPSAHQNMLPLHLASLVERYEVEVVE